MSNFQMPTTTTAAGGGGFSFNMATAAPNTTAKPGGFTFGNISTPAANKPLTFGTGLATGSTNPPVFGTGAATGAPGTTNLNTATNFLAPNAAAPAPAAAPASAAPAAAPMFGLGTALTMAASSAAATGAAPTSITTTPVGMSTANPLATGLGAATGAPAAQPSSLMSGGFSFGGGIASTPSTTANVLNATASTGSAAGAGTTLTLPTVPATTTVAPSVAFNFPVQQPAKPTQQQASAPVGTGLGMATTQMATGVVGSVAATGATGNAPVGISSTGGGFASLSTATKTTDSSAINTASQVSYNQLEEHINKWTLELEEQEKIFTDQATQINAWDKILISNNQKILELNDAIQKIKGDQSTLEQELDFISTQYRELEESLTPLQQELMTVPQADIERSQTYTMVENLDNQLKQMSEDLKEIIDNLNETSKCQDSNDPIIQIGKILNAHMSSLQWIENSSTEINNKLEEITKTHDTIKKDSERSFRSIYYN